MDSNISKIFVKLFSIFIVAIVIFLLLVFLAPDYADKYGNKPINDRIRGIKNSLFDISRPDGSLKLPLSYDRFFLTAN